MRLLLHKAIIGFAKFVGLDLRPYDQITNLQISNAMLEQELKRVQRELGERTLYFERQQTNDGISLQYLRQLNARAEQENAVLRTLQQEWRIRAGHLQRELNTVRFADSKGEC